MPVYDQMNTAALTTAKMHIYEVCQLGAEIVFVKPGTVDELGEILTESTLTLHTHPVRFSPFDRETSEKISWAENVNVIFYVAMKEIDDLSLTTADIKQYIKLRHNNKEYEISYVDNYSGFGNSFLYLIIGSKL